MNQEDAQLRELWNSEAPIPTKTGEEMLRMAIERTRTLDRQIAARNTLECAAGLFVIVFFGWMGVQAASGLERLGNWIVAASGAWIIYYMLRYGGGPKRLDAGVDLIAYRKLAVENYDRQIQLLRNVKYWYLGPPYIGLVIANGGAVRRLAANSEGIVGPVLAMAIITVVFGCIWMLNERFGVRYLEGLKKGLVDL